MPTDVDTSKAARVGSGTVWMMLATIVPALAQWLVAVLIARDFGAASLGEWVIAASIATPVILILQMPLRTLFVVAADSRTNFEDYLVLRLASVIVAVVLAAVIATVFLDREAARALVLALSLARGCEAMSDVIYAPLQREGRLASIAFLTICRVTVGQVGFMIAVVLSRDVLVGVMVLLLSNLAALLLLEYPFARSVRKDPVQRQATGSRARAIATLARAAAPLSIAQALTTVSGNLPRYLVQWWGGAAALGLYAVLEHVTLPVSLLTNAIGQSASAGFARQWNASHFTEFRGAAWTFVRLNVLVAIVFWMIAMTVGPDIISFVYGHDFHVSRNVIGIMMLAAIFAAVASSSGYILTAAGIHQQQVVVMTLAVLSNLVIGAAASTFLGWLGAVVGTMAGCVVQTAIAFALIRSRLPLAVSAAP